MQCNYCDRDFACVNESRPGVTSTVLAPAQAAAYLDEVVKKIKNIKVVGIAGPGDPFANGEETMETLRLVRERHPEMMLCVATNGLDLAPYVDDLSRLGISHVTVTVNAVDPEVGGRIYAWARPQLPGLSAPSTSEARRASPLANAGRRVYRGQEAARVLLERQVEGIRKLKEKGITLKVNTVVIPGINDGHVEEMARRVAEMGADIHNCIPLYHVAGTVFEDITPLSQPAMEAIRAKAKRYIPQMSHCSRCRADAAGMIGDAQNAEVADLLKKAAQGGPTANRPFIAVASMEGLFVNQHLGEAKGIWIYGMRDGKVDLLERRPAPPPGGGGDRWAELASLLNDCNAVLVSGVGPFPQLVLERAGIRVVVMEGLAMEGMEAIFSGRDIPKILLRTLGHCGIGQQCSGKGTGCG
jgi:nitrogen fixation protein NifB